MKRTAAEFAREALDDGPFELDIDTGGRSVKTVRPRPLSDQTYPHMLEHGRLSDVWAALYVAGATEPARTPSGQLELQPLEFRIRFRFGALKERAEKDVTEQDPRAFVADDNADYLAFRDHVWRPLPWSQVSRLLDAVDAYYDPTPATAEEKADAAGDPDGATAGKSSTDAG